MVCRVTLCDSGSSELAVGAFSMLSISNARTREGWRRGSKKIRFTVSLSASPKHTIKVIGDREREKNEAFTVHLSVPKGARIADADATGTIVNDD